ncbi:Sulfatase [compost metagenome]
MPYSLLNKGFNTLPERLRESGYQSLYAMDEKRFANIDQRYGFDVQVGPKIGAGDFLFGFLSDLPLLNIVRQLPLSRLLFPYVYSNRALSASYLGSDFVNEVDRGITSLKVDAPVFMVVHFCEPHWPYAYVSGKEMQNGWLSKFTGEGNFPNYLKALPRADEQFSSVISSLRRAGRLENALVFFVSDHGEAFARDKVTFRSAVGGKPFELFALGHGTDVVQKPQFQVLLAYQIYRNGELVSTPSHERSQRVSLLDIYPTVLQHVGLDAPQYLDGYSLLDRQERPDRKFFLETDFNVSAVLKGNIDAGEAFAQGASAYRVEPNGYVSLRPEKIDEVMQQKEYSVLSGDQVLAFGNYQDGEPGFRFFDYSNMEWRPIEGEDGDAAVLELQRALCKQFAGDPLLIGLQVCQRLNVATVR